MSFVPSPSLLVSMLVIVVAGGRSGRVGASGTFELEFPPAFRTVIPGGSLSFIEDSCGEKLLLAVSDPLLFTSITIKINLPP